MELPVRCWEHHRTENDDAVSDNDLENLVAWRENSDAVGRARTCDGIVEHTAVGAGEWWFGTTDRTLLGVQQLVPVSGGLGPRTGHG